MSLDSPQSFAPSTPVRDKPAASPSLSRKSLRARAARSVARLRETPPSCRGSRHDPAGVVSLSACHHGVNSGITRIRRRSPGDKRSEPCLPAGRDVDSRTETGNACRVQISRFSSPLIWPDSMRAISSCCDLNRHRTESRDAAGALRHLQQRHAFAFLNGLRSATRLDGVSRKE